MKKEFTDDQLVYIRDVFAEKCENYICLGKRDEAQEALDIINVVQCKQNCDEYESLYTFMLDVSDSYAYTNIRELQSEEKEAMHEMMKFAKSSDYAPSYNLINAVDTYLDIWGANGGESSLDRFKERKSLIYRIIMLCTKTCTDDELKKLDAIVTLLVKDRRN